jgi:hypothetical protein
MRHLIGIVMGMLVLTTTAFAAGNVQIDVIPNFGFGDTIIAGMPMSLQFWIANDVRSGGFQFPITLSSPDGATWDWNSQLDGWGTHKYVTHNPESRLDPPAAHFDLTNGLLVGEYNSAQIAVGGGVMFGDGMAPGSLEELFSIHITTMTPGLAEFHTLCVDITEVIGGVISFGFMDMNGVEMNPTFLDPDGNGKWCFPAYNPTCKSLPAENKVPTVEPPIIDCGDPMQNARAGLLYERTLTGEDPSLCGHPMVFSVNHITDTLYRAKTPTNQPSIDPTTGIFRWLPAAADTGLWMFTAGLRTIGDPTECTFIIDPYVCGDANGDGLVNIGDAVFIITYVFRGGPAPDPLEAADVNLDGNVNIGDAVYLVAYIFRSGPIPCFTWK